MSWKRSQGFHEMVIVKACRNCRGTGKRYWLTCQSCGGSGRVRTMYARPARWKVRR